MGEAFYKRGQRPQIRFCARRLCPAQRSESRRLTSCGSGSKGSRKGGKGRLAVCDLRMVPFLTSGMESRVALCAVLICTAILTSLSRMAILCVQHAAPLDGTESSVRSLF